MNSIDKVKLAHIVNPVVVGQESDLYQAQPVVFEAMLGAKRFASNVVDVSLYSAQYSEDHSIIPEYLMKTPDLDRSVLDVGDFVCKRKLPILVDILDRLYSATSADYLIYTNSDIIPLPFFYNTIANIINLGCDAFVINRRTISSIYKTSQELPLIYSEIGNSHLGWDCFVFPRAVYKKYILKEGCIGAPRIGLILISNLILFASNFKEFKDLHLTAHIGDDGLWKSKDYVDYKQHNTEQFCNMLSQLSRTINLHDFGATLVKFLLDLKESRYNGLKDLFDRIDSYLQFP